VCENTAVDPGVHLPRSSEDATGALDGAAYLAHAREFFAHMRRHGEAALAQVEGADVGRRLDPASNSLATLMKHLAGNMLSRWTDFLTTDGEKPDRRRDAEFEDSPADTKAALLQRWSSGWDVLFAALRGLTPTDLSRRVTIRRRPLTVFEAIERQKEHYAHHLGQLTFLAKHWAGPRWHSLSIPRGQSDSWRSPPA
jgi:hypothetical protein